MEHLPNAKEALAREILSEMRSAETFELIRSCSLRNSETVQRAIESFERGDYDPLIDIVDDAYSESLNIPDVADAANEEVDDADSYVMEEIDRIRSLLKPFRKATT